MKFPELRKQIISLASLPHSEAPTISAYFDLASPKSVLTDDFRHWIHSTASTYFGQQRDHFLKASHSVLGWLESYGKEDRGAAVFSRAGEHPLLLPLTFQAPLERSFISSPYPSIYPLVELKDRFNRFVVAITTKEFARIIEMNLGETSAELLAERSADGDLSGREWTREHYRHRSRERDRAFLIEKVAIIERLTNKRGHNSIILAGEPYYVETLKAALPRTLQKKVIDEICTDISDHRLHNVLESAIQSYLKAEKSESEGNVKSLLASVRSSGLAVLGFDRTLRALSSGSVESLVISSALGLQERESIVRLAYQHGTPIETIAESTDLERHGGVGAHLRFATPPEPSGTLMTSAA